MTKKTNKTLPESIKDVIQQYGKDTVKDVRLSNILNDVASYDEIPAAKMILRNILAEGYGEKLLNSKTDCQLLVKSFSSEICNSQGYQQEIVTFLLAAIVYGLGKTKTPPSLRPENIRTSLRPQEKQKDLVTSDLQGEMTALKKEYLHLLKKLLVIPSNRPAFYPASASTQLYYVEGKIKILSEALKTEDYQWCQQERNKILEGLYKDTSSLKKNARLKVAITAVVIIVIGIFGAIYLSAKDDIAAFKESIQHGDTYLASENYDQAFDSYYEAYTNYDAFNSSSYKADALKKMEGLVNNMMERGETNNQLLPQAALYLQKLQSLDLKETDKNRISGKQQMVQQMIDNEIDKGHNTLILNISANGGKLNEDGKRLLDELLLLSPKDYWLNFIKNKEQ